MINCFLWTLYGDFYQKRISIVGFYMEFFSLILFIMFIRGGQLQLKKHLLIVSFELWCIFRLALLARPVRFFGAVCSTGSIIFITIFITVVDRKMVRETSRPPFFETVASVANGFIWTIYALISSDKFILAANLAGGIAGIVKHVQRVKQQHVKQN